MQFRLAPISGKFLVLDAAATSVARALLLLHGNRVVWVVLRDGEKHFVFSTKEVLAALKLAKRPKLLAAALRLHGVGQSITVESTTARVNLAQSPTPGTTASRVAILVKPKSGSRKVSAIGTLKRDFETSDRWHGGGRHTAGKKRAKEKSRSQDGWPEALRDVAEEISFGFGDDWLSETPTARAVATTRSLSVIDVFYATDREVKPSNSPDAMVRYLNRLPQKGQFNYGICSVTIPEGHSLGKIESPSIWSFEIRENPNRHFTICGCARRSASEFFKELHSRVNERNEKSCFVFIHGYSVSFEDAAKRTAQLAIDLKFLGAPILYSWASAGSWRKYSKDVETVEMTIDLLSRFLAQLTQESGAKNIHLIAHSMGNRALVKALKQMTVAHGERPFNQVVLTAPDVPRQNVEPLIAATSEKAKRVTLYASRKDKALGLSKVKNDYERLGKVYGFPFVFDGMDSIDASSVKTDFWEHSVFARARTVLGDLAALIAEGRPPDRRFGLKRVASPNGLSWIFLP